MTGTRATAPGLRTITRPGPRRCLLLVAVVVVGLTGCGPAASPSQGSSPSASAVTGAASPDASGDRWPGTTVLGVIALGAADAELQKAGADLTAAADKNDLEALLGAADGLAKLIDALLPQVDRLEAYPATRAVGGLYRTALPQIGAGAKQLRDAIRKGDAAGILEGTRGIARGLEAYATARREIGPLVQLAILQQRLLLK